MPSFPEAEKRVVASLVRRDAFQLSKALAPLLGEQRAIFRAWVHMGQFHCTTFSGTGCTEPYTQSVAADRTWIYLIPARGRCALAHPWGENYEAGNQNNGA